MAQGGVKQAKQRGAEYTCRPVPSSASISVGTMKEDSKDVLVGDLLDRTGRAVRQCEIRALREIVTDALKAKVHHDLAKLPQFQEHISDLTAHAAVQGNEQFVSALAELGRLHSSTRSKCEWVPILTARLLSAGVPASFQHGDGDQRHHAAVAVTASGIPVEPDVLAKAVVEEDKGEKARRVWIRALLERVPLSEIFRCMARALTEIDGMSAQSRSHRLQHLLEVLNDQLIRVDIQVDENLCGCFRHFIAKAFANVPRPQEYRTSALTVEELIKTAIQLIRFKFRLGAEPDFYRAVALAERWLPDGGWIRLTGASAGLKQLREILLEGLLLLLEQGKPDDELLKAHRALSPDKKFAQKELSESERSARNLPSKLRRWLVSGGAKVVETKPVELDESDDLSIAMAMIVANDLRHRTEVSMDAMLDDLRFRAPVHVNTITGVVDLTRQLIDRVSFLADRRQLRLFGSPGEVVDFSPHAYRLPADAPLARRVQVRSPGVEKRGRSSSRIVVPALVEVFN